MKNPDIYKLALSMLPATPHKLVYEDELILDDNLQQADDAILDDVTYSDYPVRLEFTLALFCQRGHCRLRINLMDYSLHDGDLLLIPPSLILDRVFISADSRLVFIGQANRKDVQDAFAGGLAQRLVSHYSGKPWVLHFGEERASTFIAIYKLMRGAVADEHLDYKKEVLAGFRHAQAAYIADALQKGRQMETYANTPRETTLLKQFVSLLMTHYREHRDVSFYADRMCITPKYLSTVVSRASNRRPTEWIRQYVILDAKAMILSGNHTIQQVSDALHFANPSFFGKYFKEAVGCSPGKYAEMQRGGVAKENVSAISI